MLAALATKGDIVIKNCIPEHLDCLTSKILEIGGNVEYKDDTIHVWYTKRPTKTVIKTLPYPGFPTDLQPQMGVVLSTAIGTSIINESIWTKGVTEVYNLKHIDRGYENIEDKFSSLGANIKRVYEE